ncbi:MAG: extracellular solute-binding protein [Ruminococcaceae bacterium]|nr:extracellular solute-binding protein [Oscillospiraceae bacterium]
MKKFSIFLILAAMLLQLCACGGDKNSDETESATETATETTETTRIQHQLPDELDFDDETFTAAFMSGSGAAKNYYADESSSDNMVAAVYRRTRKAEDFLGVKVKYEENVKEEDFKTLYKSGDDIYQQLFDFTPLTFTTEGYLYNLDNLPYIDMTADWWNAEQIDLLKLSKYPYLAVNDFMITSPAAMLYNKDMVADNNLEDIYTLVFENRWTIDKFIEYGKAVINDRDGNSNYYDEDDIIAMETDDTSRVIPFMAACGQLISGKDETGRLQLIIKSEKTLQIYEKLSTIGETSGFMYHPNLYGETKRNAFANGTSLFRIGNPAAMESVTDYDFTTGIVPMPKYDEAQEKYQCYDWSDPSAVSGAIRNPELVGAVMEYLAWDSKNEVFPTYYDVLLKTRYSQDLETRQMMDIIFENIVYEVGGLYFGMQPGFCELWYMPLNPMYFGEKNFNAFYRAYKSPANNTINSFYEAMEKIEGPLVEETAEETAVQ